MKNTLFAQIGLAFIILAVSAQACAESYMKQIRHTDPFTVMGQTQPAKNETVETWIGDKATRIDNPDGTSTLMVIADKKAYIINRADRSYAEIPMNIDKIIDQAASAAGDAQGADSKVAAAAMRGMMQSMMQFKVSLKETAEQQKIGDWRARKYMLTTTTGMGTSTSEIWATEDLHADMTAYWEAANAMLAGQPGFADMVNEMAKIKGVVVRTISRSQAMGATVKSTEDLVEFANRPAPAGTFIIPAGYRKVPMLSK